MKKIYESIIYFKSNEHDIFRLNVLSNYFNSLGYNKIGTAEDDLCKFGDDKEIDMKQLIEKGILLQKNKHEFVLINSSEGLFQIVCLIKLNNLKTNDFFMSLAKSIGADLVYGYIDQRLITDERHWQTTTVPGGSTMQKAVGTSLLEDGIPGIFYLNLFGAALIDLIGYQIIKTAPSVSTIENNGNIFLQSRENIDSREKISIEYELKTMAHIGIDYFWNPPNNIGTRRLKIDHKREIFEKVKKNVNPIDAKLTKEMQEMAEEAISLSKDELNEELDYSENSVKRIENILSKYFSYSDVDIEKISLSYGALLGEIIRKNIGGEWNYYSYQGDQLIALLGANNEDSVIFPVNKVAKRLEQGRGDDIVSYYKILKSKKI